MFGAFFHSERTPRYQIQAQTVSSMTQCPEVFVPPSSYSHSEPVRYFQRFRISLQQPCLKRKTRKGTFKVKLLATASALLLLATPVFAHERVESSIALPSIAPNGSYTATISCGSRYHVTGGGYIATNKVNVEGPISVTGSYPSSKKDWSVTFSNRSGRSTTSGETQGQLFAICSAH